MPEFLKDTAPFTRDNKTGTVLGIWRDKVCWREVENKDKSNATETSSNVESSNTETENVIESSTENTTTETKKFARRNQQ